MAKIILGLGGNIGDVKQTFKDAVYLMMQNGIITNKRVSDTYKSESLLKDGQPDYYNTIIVGETELTPLELLEAVEKVEVRLGRVKTKRWGERVIDIDIIDYDNIVFDTPELTIPHKEMANRSFVIMPMLDVIPDYQHPVSKKSLLEMYNTLKDLLNITQTAAERWLL